MPRVTPSTHYQRYTFLRAAWLEFPKLYVLLPLEAQWQVHEFYQPSQEFTQDELTAHIKALSETKPALVHQVGKHFRLLETVFTVISEQLDITKEDGYRMLGAAVQQIKPLRCRHDRWHRRALHIIRRRPTGAQHPTAGKGTA